MDPKSIANLDPKLRETYERVMGNAPAGAPAPVSAASPAPASSETPAPLSAAPSPSPELSPSPAPSAPPPDFSAPTSPPTSPEPQLSTPSTMQPTGASIPASTPYTPADLGLSAASQPDASSDMQPLTSPATVAQTTSGKGSLIKILYVFGGIVFFVVYVFFWIKIFNYTLPF